MPQQFHWQLAPSHLFTNATRDGIPLVLTGQSSLLTASTPQSPLPFKLSHRLHPNTDLLQATLEISNPTPTPQTIVIEFATSALPSPAAGTTRAYLPLTAQGLFNHPALADLGKDQLADCDLPIGCPGQNSANLICHYLEPEASEPSETQTHASLLIPLITTCQPNVPWKISLFTSPQRPWRFAWTGTAAGRFAWTARTRILLPPNSTHTEHAWLLLHDSPPDSAWAAFHQHAHPESLPRIDWLDHVKVHYFDFLSPGLPDGKRGTGFDQSSPHFREFRVGLATQHGYYPHWGDYIHPDRKSWLAMRGDAAGPAEMSLDILRRRIADTRNAGARAAIYLHLVGFDPSSPLDPILRDATRIRSDGSPQLFDGWAGPDIEQTARFMSISAPDWSNHLLQQAQWIMELLNPDAIVVDETFGGLGYDRHPNRPGPVSPHMIAFMKKLRLLLRSFGPDKALLTSDCSLSSFVLFADAEGGDHAYPKLLGHDLYRKPPIRFLSALHTKPWLPCAWQFNGLWESQLDLAQKTHAGVGLANGWIEYTGLALLPPQRRAQILSDIASLNRK